MAVLDGLWGSILNEVRLDPVEFAAHLRVRVAHEGATTAHNLKLVGSEFHISNSIPLPWTYAEVTEIRAIALANNRVRIELILLVRGCSDDN
jgi:hypothetical protein